MKCILFLLSSVALVAAGFFPADHRSFMYEGRFDFSDPAAPRFSWPGIAISVGFTGQKVSVVLEDGLGRYDIWINDSAAGVLSTDSGTEKVDTFVVARDLPKGAHELRLIKRNETAWSDQRFHGVVVSAGETLFTPSLSRTGSIEILGDSFVAGYGNEASGRDSGLVPETTNTGKSFGHILADRLGAKRHILAYSGKGMVQNLGGDSPGREFPAYYEATVHADIEQGREVDIWDVSSWNPDLTIIHLGINDFSDQGAAPPADTALFRKGAESFLHRLRTKNTNPSAHYLFMAFQDWPNRYILQSLQRLIRDEHEAGHEDVALFSYTTSLDALHWHPSVEEHAEIAEALEGFIYEQGLFLPTSVYSEERDRPNTALVNITSQGYRLSEEISSVSVYSVRGEHQELHISERVFSLDDKLSPGMYILSVQTHAGKRYHRLIRHEREDASAKKPSM